MVTTVVLINAERGKVNDVAQALVDIPGVTEVFSVAGRWDLVAILRVSDNEAMADLVTQGVHTTPGIVHTETMLAFKAYSRHDLARLFSIGMEEDSVPSGEPS